MFWRRWGIRAAAVAAVALLAACGSPQATAVASVTPSPVAAGHTASRGAIAASGVVKPAQEATLGFAAAGQVKTLNVELGEKVEAGQTLAELEGSERQEAAMTAAVAMAEMELLNARQALQAIQDGGPMAIARAQMTLAGLQKQLDDAQRSLRYLTAPDIKYYQTQVTDAQDALATALENVTLTDIGDLGAVLRAAQERADDATDILRDAQDGFAECPECTQVWVGSAGRMMEMKDAQKQYDDALNSLHQAQILVAQATRSRSSGVATAQDNLTKAQQALASATQGPDAIKLAQAQANISWLEAQIVDTKVQLEKIGADGIDKDKLAAAQARITTAEAALAAARVAPSQLTLTAPFGGTVVALPIVTGAAAVPGQPAIQLADLDHLQAETTDLSEKDSARVRVGQAATIYVEALDQEIQGQVLRIAPQATALGGDVVFAVTLSLAEQPAGLLWGMSVTVEIVPAGD
jgi:multidrug efflux pump subunit AcrA (membrane-fusion protein)